MYYFFECVTLCRTLRFQVFNRVCNCFICCLYKKWADKLSPLLSLVHVLSKPFYFLFNGKYCLNWRFREILEYFLFFKNKFETKPERHFAFIKEFKKKKKRAGGEKKGKKNHCVSSFFLGFFINSREHFGVIGGFVQAKARTEQDMYIVSDL